MNKTQIELKNQLDENLSVHKDLLKLSKDIIQIIQIIKKKN